LVLSVMLLLLVLLMAQENLTSYKDLIALMIILSLIILQAFLSDPTAEQIACQAPKPILLNTGGITFPVPWTPSIIPLQIIQIGNLYIVAVPGEFSTMSGRRLRNTVTQTLIEAGVTGTIYVLIAGLSNSYTHYITTFQEYEVQRYEGGSTLYGPNTLGAYQQLYAQLANSLVTGAPLPPAPEPINITTTISFILPVIEDCTPFDVNFGDIYQDVNKTYAAGDIAQVVFWGASLRNNYHTQGTFLTVEQQISNSWNIIAYDADWETRLYWTRRDLTESLITIEWYIPTTQQPGSYRIRHFGDSKDIFGTITPFNGTSSVFTVTSSTFPNNAIN